MLFTVIENWNEVPADARDRAFLVVDNWDDWFEFRTTFTLWVFDENAARHHLGSVKIGQVGLVGARAAPDLPKGLRTPDIDKSFDALGPQFFSLGRDENYYETLMGLSANWRNRVLVGLRDFAYDLDLFEAVRHESVTTTSLLRGISASIVRGRLNRLAHGNAVLTEFKFNYVLPIRADGVVPPTIRFEVKPDSIPPTNVHVLIGRNGVGKTQCMRGLAEALLGRPPLAGENHIGQLAVEAIDDADEGEWYFAGLVMVCFSAFDDFILAPRVGDRVSSNHVGLVGLTTGQDGEAVNTMKSLPDLAADFCDSFEACRHGLRSDRWRTAVATLESDDLFAEAGVSELLEQDDQSWPEIATKLFLRLSSGHAIVLLTITRLVELVDERTLVLLDEPEGHLHPPLLSAFIRALSDLLKTRNGVAVVATHSPVVLQEVPQSCSWKLRRNGRRVMAERPVVETFGENVSVLTREVFGFEVGKAGFHRLIDEAVNGADLDYEQVLVRFSGQLGSEAKSIARALIAERDAE